MRLLVVGLEPEGGQGNKCFPVVGNNSKIVGFEKRTEWTREIPLSPAKNSSMYNWTFFKQYNLVKRHFATVQWRSAIAKKQVMRHILLANPPAGGAW